MRNAIFTAHLFSAWATGAVLVVLSVTGALLVFENTMDTWLDPAVATVKPGPGRLTLFKVVEIATAFSGGERATEVHPGGLDRSTMVVTERQTRIYVDPHNGAILGTRKGLLPSVHLRQLHKTLLGGRIGERVVVGTTFLLVFQSLSGLYLWWPLKRMALRTGISSRRFIVELHHALGFYSALFICAVGITGLVRFFPVQHATPLPSVKFDNVAGRISVDEAQALAEKQFPGARLVRINLPLKKGEPFVVSARYPGDESPFGLSEVHLDQHDGHALFVQDLRKESESDRTQRIDRAIHTGAIGGLPTRTVAFLTCLAILTETGSGMWMWWKRTKRPAVKLARGGKVSAVEFAKSER